MKFVIRAVAAAVISLAASMATHAAALYDYSYTFGDGIKINGSFEGDANGNLISNLVNITAYVDGVALNGSGNLFAASMNTNGWDWTAGNGVASFNGTENNFLFIDSNYPVSRDFTNYVFSIPFYSSNTDYALAYTEKSGLYAIDYPSVDGGPTLYSAGRWTVNAVPEPTSVALLGLGLLGFAASRRKAAKK